jgi:transposase
MFSNQERYRVQQLRKAGIPVETVEQITGVSQRSIRRIVQAAEVTSAEEPALGERKRVGRPSEISEYSDEITVWLAEERDPRDGPMKSQEVLARLRQRGYTGGKTAVYELVKQLRPPKSHVPMVRFEGLPGEFSQHDFGQRRVQYTDGRIEVVRFFASRLKYSRYVAVQVVDNEQQETVVRCLLRAFEHFGGVPLMGVFDNMSSAVKSREVKADGTVTVHWSERFAQRQMLLDLDPSVEPYVTELVHRRPHTWRPDIEQMYQLYEQVGRADLLAAIALATEARCFGSEYVLAMLQSATPGLTPSTRPQLSL